MRNLYFPPCFSATLKDLEAGGIGICVFSNRRGQYYLRPSPESLGVYHDLFMQSGTPYASYHNGFNDVSRMTKRELTVCRQYHPQLSQITPLLDKAPAALLPDNEQQFWDTW